MALMRDRDDDVEDLLNRGALWAVTYGDLMSYLMIFFLIMFTFSTNGEKTLAQTMSAMQENFGGKAESEGIERIAQRTMETKAAEDLKDKFYDKGVEKFAKVTVTEQRIMITLKEAVLFDSGHAELNEHAAPVLHEFAEVVRLLPNRIVVEGHTDSIPIRRGKYESNWELSMSRAYSVIKHLVEKEGVAPRNISGSGYGEYQPVASNATPEGRAANRRIEIGLLRAN